MVQPVGEEHGFAGAARRYKLQQVGLRVGPGGVQEGEFLFAGGEVGLEVGEVGDVGAGFGFIFRKKACIV